MKKCLLLKVIVLTCLLCLGNVTVAQNPFPPDRFPVKVDSTVLEINDCSGRRFFLAGMVDNKPNSGCQLSLYDPAEMEAWIANSKAIGATAMRWNAFLRGKDLKWDANGYVTGMCDNAVANIKDGLDRAYAHGIVLQIVLATAHFLQYGADGETPENVERVNNNKFMFEDTVATQAYIDNVIKPITQTIGVHPGLFGYCIINEASGMYYEEDAETGTWSDVKVHLADFQRYINLVASEIHTNQPGAILSVSGVAYGIYQYGDSVLIEAGGKSNGTMDIHQVQFYPNNHGEEWSPYLHTPEAFVDSFGGGLKPFICGETPIEGIIDDGSGKFKGSEEFGLYEAYTRLWDNGHSGGFTWSYNVYENMSSADKDTVDAAYTNFYDNYLVDNDFNGSQCPNHLYASPVTQTVTVPAGSTEISVISDINWTASSDAGWCTLDPSSGSSNDTITVSYTENTGAERTANITFSATGVSDYIVEVNQDGDHLRVTPGSTNVSRSKGKTTLTVESNLNWTASSDANWCTLDPSSGSNDGTVTASYPENTGAERTANITFSATGVPDTVVTITQAEYVSIGVFQQDSGSDKIVSMGAEHYHNNVDGSGDYSTHSWISATTPSGYTGDEAMVTDPNNGTNISTVSTAEDNAPRLEFTVNFVTTGTHYIWLRVNTNGSGGDNSIHAGLNGTISAVRLECGTSSDWVWKSYKSDGNRPTINVPSTGEHTFGLFMREDGMRVDKIVLTTNVDYVPTGTGPAESEQSGAGSLAVTPTSSNVGPSSGSVDLTVTSNLNWTASSDVGWCTLDPSSGSNDGTVTASYTENTGAERTANITFSATGVSDVVVTVTQADGSSAAGFQQDSGSDKIVSMEAENYHFNTDGSGDYSSHSWISTSTPSGYSGTGAMVTDPNNGTNISDVSTAEANAPLLEFTVNFVTTGTHYIWLRVNTNNSGGDNSIHAGLNGSITAVRMECGISSDWVWKSYKAGGGRPTIDVTSTGEHTFGLFMREDGMRVDKIVLTTNVNYTPSGTGPAESQNNGAGQKSATIATSVKLPAINNEINLNVYPNPGNNNIHLDFGSNLVEDVKVDVLNIAGQKIISKIYKSLQLEKGIDLSLHNLDAGIYLIRCEAADWKQSVKFIKK